MKDEKKLVWLVNGTPEEEEFVKKALGEDFRVTPVHYSISPAVQKQLKRLIEQDGLYGAVCCLDADGPTEQHKAWFSARYLMRSGIPVVCYSLEEYDKKEWKMLKHRFPELDTDVPYFVLSYQEEQADFILSALKEQPMEKEKRLREEKKRWTKFKRKLGFK